MRDLSADKQSFCLQKRAKKSLIVSKFYIIFSYIMKANIVPKLKNIKINYFRLFVLLFATEPFL